MQLKKLAEYDKKCGSTDVIVAGDFNESVCYANIQHFINETGLHDVFQEINGVEPERREATHENGSKCTDYVLETEGMLRNVTGIEIIECSEIVESDHRVYLTDVYFQIILWKSSLKAI